MTIRNYFGAALIAVVVAGTASIGSAQHEQAWAKGSSVTLTSCVEKAQNKDAYVLTHVADVPVHPPMPGTRVVYWLDKDTAKKLGPHVGHQIRVAGTVSEVRKGEMDMKVDEGGMIVELEGPGRDVDAKPAQTGVPASRVTAKQNISTTVVKLKVDKLDMVAPNCPLAR